MSAKVKVRIDQDGNVHFEVAGVEGASCEQLTEALVRASGDEVDKEYTEDYILDLPDLVEQFEE